MFYKEIYQMRFRIIVFVLVFIALAFMMMAFKPMFDELMEVYSQASASNSNEFIESLKAISTAPEKINENTWFLATQWYGKNYGQFIPLLALIMSLPLICRETENKTIYILLSKFKRKDIIITKYLSGLVGMITVIFLANISGPIVMKLFGYNVNAFTGMYALAPEIIGSTFIFSVFFMISVICNEILKPMIIGIVIVVILPLSTAFINSSIFDIFTYMTGIKYLLNTDSQLAYSSVLIILSVILFYLSLKFFERKEF